MKKNKFFLIALATLIITVLLSSTLIFAISPKALEAQQAIESAEEDMLKLQQENITVQRYNDTLELATQFYEAKSSAEAAGESVDYSIIFEKTDELKEIKDLAFQTLDEFKALTLTIKETEELNLSEAIIIYEQAESELKSERYEKSQDLIEQTYEKISELRAEQTKLKVFYSATSRGFINFFKIHWIATLITIFIVISFVLLTYKPFYSKIINKKIIQLGQRKESVRKLIAKTQKDYFTEGKISDTDYSIRTKKYAEIIRDINRQIPLLKEKIELIHKKKKTTLDNSDKSIQKNNPEKSNFSNQEKNKIIIPKNPPKIIKNKKVLKRIQSKVKSRKKRKIKKG